MTKRDILCSLSIFGWLGVAIISLAAMYHLLWSRERTLYVGKSANDQRAVVLRRAGITPETLEIAKLVDSSWPRNVAYKADGSEVSLSYFKYLVLPRIPSGSDEYRIGEVGVSYALSATNGTVKAHRLFETVAPSPRGLILSVLVLFTIATGLSRFGLSLPEGMAGASLLLYTATVLLKPAFHSYTPIGIFMCAMSAAGLLITRKRDGKSFTIHAARELQPGNWRKAFRLAAMVVLGGTILWSLLMAVVVVPDDWDAWAQWGPKAKILAVSTGAFSDVKYFVPGSGDYPLLWPSIWAFSGWCAGGWEEQWSKGWGPLFLILTAWQLGRIASNHTSRRDVGILAATAFVSMPAIPLVASWAYAEAPLWLMLACATGRLLQWQSTRKVSDICLAGMFTAAAACTKNEGVLFGVLAAIWLYLNSRRLLNFALFLAPIISFYGSWRVYVHFSIQNANHAVSGLGAVNRTIIQWLDVMASAGTHVLNIWMDPKQWLLVLPVLVLASGWLMICGQSRDRLNLFLPWGFLAGLFAVVLSHGQDWSWQLSVAWNRLTIQGLVVLIPILTLGLSRVLIKADGKSKKHS